MSYPGAHNSDELKNKLFRVGGWVGGLVGEAGNKTNSALLSWGLAELGKNKNGNPFRTAIRFEKFIMIEMKI